MLRGGCARIANISPSFRFPGRSLLSAPGQPMLPRLRHATDRGHEILSPANQRIHRTSSRFRFYLARIKPSFCLSSLLLYNRNFDGGDYFLRLNLAGVISMQWTNVFSVFNFRITRSIIVEIWICNDRGCLDYNVIEI